MVDGAEVETALDPSEFVDCRKKVVGDSCMVVGTALVENYHRVVVENFLSSSVSTFPLFTRIYL